MNHCKRPWDVFWDRGGLREQDAWVVEMLSIYANQLLNDKVSATAGERAAIHTVATAYGAVLLILEDLKRHGFTRMDNGALEVTPAAMALPKFLTVIQSGLKLVKLDRRVKVVDKGLHELLAATKESA